MSLSRTAGVLLTVQVGQLSCCRASRTPSIAK
jgi:hypothetical protein